MVSATSSIPSGGREHDGHASCDCRDPSVTQPLLEVSNLTVEFATRNGTVTAVRKVDLVVAKGETVGIVGESGSGKSVTSYAVMRFWIALEHRAGHDQLLRHSAA